MILTESNKHLFVYPVLACPVLLYGLQEDIQENKLQHLFIENQSHLSYSINTSGACFGEVLPEMHSVAEIQFQRGGGGGGGGAKLSKFPTNLL